MVFIIYGVSSSGKTTIGKKISSKLGVPFYDADDFHSDVNIKKMSNGIPLNDQDRLSWLQKISHKIHICNSDIGAVFACSALKEKYRKILTGSCSKEVRFIFLKIDKSEATKRLEMRKKHFFPLALLDNQFQVLEKSSNAIEVNASNQIELVCDEIYAKII